MRKRIQQADPADELPSSADPMLCLDGKTRKRWCPGCGGPRDPVYAETHPCTCCGSYGTQKVRPEFDENDEPIVVAPVERPKPAARAPQEQAKPTQPQKRESVADLFVAALY